MNTRALILLAAISVSALVLAGCGGDQQGQAQQSGGDRAETGADERTDVSAEEPAERNASTEDAGAATTRAEDTEARGGDNEAEGSGRATEEGSGEEDRGRGERVTLEIQGSPGSAFFGVCRVGDEEAKIAGEVPQHFVYYPEDREIHCELHKEDAGSGNLKVVLAAPGNRIVQQTNAISGNVELTFSGNGGGSSSVSTSTTSTGSGSQVSSSSYSVNSKSVNSNSVSSSSSASSNSR